MPCRGSSRQRIACRRSQRLLRERPPPTRLGIVPSDLTPCRPPAGSPALGRDRQLHTGEGGPLRFGLLVTPGALSRPSRRRHLALAALAVWLAAAPIFSTVALGQTTETTGAGATTGSLPTDASPVTPTTTPTAAGIAPTTPTPTPTATAAPTATPAPTTAVVAAATPAVPSTSLFEAPISVQRGDATITVRPAKVVQTSDGKKARAGVILVGFRSGVTDAQRGQVHAAMAARGLGSRSIGRVGLQAEKVESETESASTTRSAPICATRVSRMPSPTWRSTSKTSRTIRTSATSGRLPR